MTKLVPRETLRLLRSAFEGYACVLLLGPRQVGKTTLAQEFAKEYWIDWKPDLDYMDLEKDEDRHVLQDFDNYVMARNRKIIVLDEAQCMPEMFPKLRNLLDTPARSDNEKTRWLILGSAAEELEALANTHLGGRFKKMRLTPFHFPELNAWQSVSASTATADNLANLESVSPARKPAGSHGLIKSLWLRGGFPRSFLAENDQDSFEWRREYLGSILGPQSPARIEVKKADLLIPLWERLAIEQGKCNIEKLPGILRCCKKDLFELLDFLEAGHLIRKVRPWHKNQSKRLNKQPLWYIRDSGLLHSQLRLKTIDTLQENEIKGKSWESFVLESLLASVQSEPQYFYYRSEDRDEADFVLEFDTNRRWVIEVKFSGNHSVSSGFYSACEELQPEQRFVVHGGPESYKSGKQETLDWFCLSDALFQFSSVNQ